MNATEKKYVEKLKELVQMYKILNKMNSWKYPTHRKFTDAKNIVKFEIVELESEISALESQSEESYPREFVEWYSGMEFIKIDSAFKRWKRETGNQK